MIPLLRGSKLSRALLLAAFLGLTPGCTLFDDYMAGTPFTPDQPVAEVTVEGEILVDPVELSSETCPAGGTILWGNVRNTGDLDVDDVFIEIGVFDSSNGLLGTYRTSVFNGEVTEGSGATPVTSAGTSLSVDQAGNFEVCTPLSFDSVVKTTYRTGFVVIEEVLI